MNDQSHVNPDSYAVDPKRDVVADIALDPKDAFPRDGPIMTNSPRAIAILEALGVETKNLVRAVVAFEVGDVVRVECTHLAWVGKGFGTQAYDEAERAAGGAFELATREQLVCRDVGAPRTARPVPGATAHALVYTQGKTK